MNLQDFKDIPGYQGVYKISKDGKVYSCKTSRLLNQSIDSRGYYTVHLITDKDKRCSVHRLVAITYLPNPKNLPTVDHIDRNKLNNNLTNLRWATMSTQNQNRNWTEARQAAANKGGAALSKKIECRNKNNHNILIATYDSTCQAAREMFGDVSKNSLISRCARGEKASAYGYWWRYTDNEET